VAQREIAVGGEVHDALTFHGDKRIFELTGPSDGTLVVRVTWDPDRGRLELKLSDTTVASDPPIVGRLRVAAGERYLVTVADYAPWDYDDLFLPFVLTASVEEDGGNRQSVSFRVEAEAFGDGGQGCWQGPFLLRWRLLR